VNDSIVQPFEDILPSTGTVVVPNGNIVGLPGTVVVLDGTAVVLAETDEIQYETEVSVELDWKVFGTFGNLVV
jgi:hypothetical protein